MYIALEGVNGSGKTTIAAGLKKWMNKTGNKKTHVVHDPDIKFGLGKLILKKWRNERDMISDNIWALYFSVSSIGSQSFSNIDFKLIERCNIISDRCALSNYAYYWNQSAIKTLDEIHSCYLIPEIIIYLDVDCTVIDKRLSKRKRGKTIDLKTIKLLKANYENSINYLQKVKWNIHILSVNDNENCHETLNNVISVVNQYIHC